MSVVDSMTCTTSSDVLEAPLSRRCLGGRSGVTALLRGGLPWLPVGNLGGVASLCVDDAKLLPAHGRRGALGNAVLTIGAALVTALLLLVARMFTGGPPVTPRAVVVVEAAQDDIALRVARSSASPRTAPL